MQRLLQPSSVNGYGHIRAEGMPDHFPAGLRVLVVDDDLTCLKILEQMLRKCMYAATTCSRATIALSLLRENKGAFDVVISDVHMPDMDGYKLLEHVGLEMDLPVIMMSADGSTSAVMRGIKHGACDYLIKPVRLEELKNIWQHVIRKKCIKNKENEQSGSIDDNEGHKRPCDEAEYASSSVNEGTDASWKVHKKRSLKEEEDESEPENEDRSSSKKPRVVWSVELHQQFVNAVNQLGIEKAVPKRILELMSVPGLTRENVASHLQKFRLYLKRLSAQNQGSMCGSFGAPVELNGKMPPITNASLQALAASGQMPPQTFAALHAEILGCHYGSLVMPSVDQTTMLQEAFHGSNGNLVENGAFPQSLMKSQAIVSKRFAQASIPIDDSSGYLAWQQPLGTTVSSNNMGGLNSYGGNLLVQIHHQQQHQPMPLASAHALNLQPSCLVSPTSSTAFLARNNPVSSSGNHNLGNTSFTGSPILDYCLVSSPRQGPVRMEMSDGDINSVGLLRCYPVGGSVSSTPSSGSIVARNNVSLQSWEVQNPAHMMAVNTTGRTSSFDLNPREISYGLKGSYLLDHDPSQTLGFAIRGAK